MTRRCPNCKNNMDVAAKICPVCKAESEASTFIKIVFTIYSLGIIGLSIFMIIIILMMMKSCLFHESPSAKGQKISSTPKISSAPARIENNLSPTTTPGNPTITVPPEKTDTDVKHASRINGVGVVEGNPYLYKKYTSKNMPCFCIVFFKPLNTNDDSKTGIIIVKLLTKFYGKHILADFKPRGVEDLGDGNVGFWLKGANGLKYFVIPQKKNDKITGFFIGKKTQ